ncbi:MAG: hemerythrin domain-containing protein, partial [Bacteroidota bacterium]
IQEFCDIHTAVLDGNIDHSMAKLVPPGHPVDTFTKENEAVARVTAHIMQLAEHCESLSSEQAAERVLQLRALFNELGDLDKHYRRKENLLFPFLEQRGITGPPTVMWGKQDEIRQALKSAREALGSLKAPTAEQLSAAVSMMLVPAVRGVDDMIMKEEQILLPMCMDQLTELEWFEIQRQTPEIGFCLYDPQIEWKP